MSIVYHLRSALLLHHAESKDAFFKILLNNMVLRVPVRNNALEWLDNKEHTFQD